ncbi:MAG: cob(I)yrinic acid a,c-diamide adenosyltransferase [Verrucomicrobiota bacterium]
MKISTKTGDGGETSLLYGRRVSKSDPRVAAYGAVDELTAALGMARAQLADHELAAELERIQRELIALMGLLALHPDDQERYATSKMPKFEPDQVEALESKIHELEAAQGSWTHWVLPGANLPSAALELARAVCRRAERGVVGISEGAVNDYADVLVYLNRLADLLWLMARAAEREPTPAPPR